MGGLYLQIIAEKVMMGKNSYSVKNVLKKCLK